MENKIQIPKEITICGIRYRVTDKETMIIFSSAYDFYGCCSRMVFTKEQKRCWRVQVLLTFDTIIAKHICEAYHLVCQWRGKDFE